MPQRYTHDREWITSLTLDGRELLTAPVPLRLAPLVITANMEPEFVIESIDYTGRGSLLRGRTVPMHVFTTRGDETTPQGGE